MANNPRVFSRLPIRDPPRLILLFLLLPTSGRTPSREKGCLTTTTTTLVSAMLVRKDVFHAGKYALILALILTVSMASPHHKHSAKDRQGEKITHPRAFETCQERTCASRVSACLLMEKCYCAIESCHCCADCMRCLGSLWKDCCDCVGLCLPPNNTKPATSDTSTVGNFRPDQVPSGLFKALSLGSNLPAVYQDRQSQNSSGRSSFDLVRNWCVPLYVCVVCVMFGVKGKANGPGGDNL